MWLAKTVAKSVVLLIVAIGLLGAASASAPPAHTALPSSPSQSGNFAVDSFFDITYEIEFEGAPGSVLEGMTGTTQGTVRVDVNPGCIVPDNGTGTADLPPVGCQYQSLNDFWYIIDGLPPGDTIEIDAILWDFINTVEAPGGNLGGDRQTYDATLQLPMTGTGTLTGFYRDIPMQVAVETHSGPRTLGDPVQTFPTDMVSLHGEIYNDLDFNLLVITAGTDYGKPSPGETTLSEEMDYGDAPDPTYPTLRANDGARHVYDPAGPFMGTQPDVEPDGQPTADATGDDINNLDDEDGVTFSNLVAGDVAADITIDLTNSPADCKVNAWIDFDGDGAWSMGAPEQILTDEALTAGSTHTRYFSVPLTAVLATDTFARVRCSSASGLAPTGLANDGEVEDYAVVISGYDYGDAPDPPYPTLFAATNNGASHKIDPNFLLGALIDAEWDGQPHPNALGDDNTTLDDEDGITFLAPLLPGQQACIQVDVINTTSFNAALAAWIDFDGNGTWEPAEHLFDPVGGVSEPLPANSNTLCFTVPANASRGPTYARFRLDSGVTNPTPYGTWFIGEVEDYQVYIEATKWEQPPTFNPESIHPECYWGWDEVSDWEIGPIVADDWLCEDDRPVTDIHWWGSYVGWPENDPPTDAPPQFHIGVWSDVPAGGEPPWSHPGVMIQEWIVPRTDLNERVVGCDFHPSAPGPDTCFAYDFEIPRELWFVQEPGPTVYWLSISAMNDPEQPQEFAWGWKTREHNFNDAAVRMFDPIQPGPGAMYVAGEPIMLNEERWDMAFILTTQPGPPEAPVVDIAIDATGTDVELSWPHITKDIYGYDVTVVKYNIYRDPAPYQGAAATLVATINWPFASSLITWIDPGPPPNTIGDPAINHYYYVQAVAQDMYSNDVPSALSNHVGEFDFALVKGSP